MSDFLKRIQDKTLNERKEKIEEQMKKIETERIAGEINRLRQEKSMDERLARLQEDRLLEKSLKHTFQRHNSIVQKILRHLGSTLVNSGGKTIGWGGFRIASGTHIYDDKSGGYAWWHLISTTIERGQEDGEYWTDFSEGDQYSRGRSYTRFKSYQCEISWLRGLNSEEYETAPETEIEAEIEKTGEVYITEYH